MKRRTFTDEFKVAAVEKVEDIGLTRAAREAGVSCASIISWRKKIQEGELGQAIPNATEMALGDNRSRYGDDGVVRSIENRIKAAALEAKNLNVEIQRLRECLSVLDR